MQTRCKIQNTYSISRLSSAETVGIAGLYIKNSAQKGWLSQLLPCSWPLRPAGLLAPLEMTPAEHPGNTWWAPVPQCSCLLQPSDATAAPKLLLGKWSACCSEARPMLSFYPLHRSVISLNQLYYNYAIFVFLQGWIASSSRHRDCVCHLLFGVLFLVCRMR